MHRSEYFNYMQECSNAVIPRILLYYNQLAHDDKSLASILRHIVSSRTHMGQKLLRPSLVRMGYEYGTERSWTDIIDICASVEMYNISTYQSNIALDNKQGIISSELVSSQFIASQLSLSLACEVCNHNALQIFGTSKANIHQEYIELNNSIYRGQHLSIHDMSDLDYYMTKKSEDFIRMYRLRCELLGGKLIAFCLRIGAIMGEADNCMISQLNEVGNLIGTGGQMLNDVADYIPNELYIEGRSCVYKDTFSDLSNGQLTYPLYHLLTKCSEAEYRMIMSMFGKRLQSTKEQQFEIFKMLVDYNAFDATMVLIRQQHKAARIAIKKMPKHRIRKLLGMAASTLITNKYYAILKNFTLRTMAYEEKLKQMRVLA